jgi:hypothetical protein
MKIWVNTIFAVVMVCSSASLASANSVPVRVRSNFGSPAPPLLTISGTQNDVDGIVELQASDLDDNPSSSSDNCSCSFVEVLIPSLTPGTTIDFQGFSLGTDLSNVFVNGNDTMGVLGLSVDSGYLNGTSPFLQSVTAQMLQECWDSANPTPVAGGFEITAPSCALATDLDPSGSRPFGNSVALEFDYQSAFATSVKVVTPEPGTLVFLGIGILGLMSKRLCA